MNVQELIKKSLSITDEETEIEDILFSRTAEEDEISSTISNEIY